jgi:PAS domain S-box-containing protein
VFHIVNETTRAKVESPVTKVLRDGGIVGLANHTVLVSRGGREHAIDDSAAPIRGASGELLGVVLVFRDVDERRAAELTSLRIAAIVQGTDDAIIGKNLKGIVTDWNPSAERIFGYTAAEMIGQPITKVIPAERLEEEPLILARLQRGERVDHFETVRMTKSGQPIDVSLTISPIKDSEGHVIGASKIARDITAQKAAEVALQQARAKLEEHTAELELKVRDRTEKLQGMIAELEAFSYSLSHDLRAPLRAIQSFTEIVIADYGEKIPEGVTYLNKVVSAAARMDRLIQDVLAFARISRTDIRVAPLDVDKLVRDIIHERPELHAPNAHVEVRGKLLPVMGHDASLTQCLTNLLDNAVKFVAPGVSPRVEIFTTALDGKVRLSVRDNGIGIDEQGQRKLFGIFERLPTQQQYRGTGVGLAIVRKAAERMQGRAGVESAPGKGSTFWVELPRA